MINPMTMEMLKVEVAEIMSTLEKVFPPSTFDVMSHLVIHIVEELKLYGLSTQGGCTQGVLYEGFKGIYEKLGRP